MHRLRLTLSTLCLSACGDPEARELNQAVRACVTAHYAAELAAREYPPGVWIKPTLANETTTELRPSTEFRSPGRVQVGPPRIVTPTLR